MRARTENKPIFLSIGYAACHWCHVMAHESFENPEIAALMNEHFVCIKVDREERPDIDSIYMQATMALTGSGGWPMSVFLTPDLRPFYAGTYFPPVRRHNMPSFKEVLQSLIQAWKAEPEQVDRVAGQVLQHLQPSTEAGSSGSFSQETLNAITKAILDSYDWGNGGWGSAPKFPQPMTIEYLLRRSIPDSPMRDDTLKAAFHALKAMARGGMYDVVGGGFARYSTDNFWRVPHFEKMLYDNAQLARVYLHAWQVDHDPLYKRVVTETLDFVKREMTHPEAGFYSSLDADSDGEEGKYYVWTADEIRTCLGGDADFFETAYGITERGNWEGRIVLQRALDDASLAVRFHLDVSRVAVRLADCHARLLQAREKRVHPGTDDKVLTAWNGLMLQAIAEAARVLDDKAKRDEYLQLATRNADFLLSALRPDGKLRRAWRNGKTTNEVFLEDYASLINALLELYQTDFDNRWFSAAQQLADEMIVRFSDPAGGFFDTPQEGETLLIRPKDIQDNATPSGNAMACDALLRLAALTARGEYHDLTEKSLGPIVDIAARYPMAVARWLSAADFALDNGKQIAILYEAGDENAAALLEVVRAKYRPDVVSAASVYPPPKDAPPLLAGRPLKDGKATVFVCEHFVCKEPVNTPLELQKQL